MKEMDTTKIISVGLVGMGLFSVLGYYVCMFMGLNPTIEPTISIITGLFGMVGVVKDISTKRENKEPTREPSNLPAKDFIGEERVTNAKS